MGSGGNCSKLIKYCLLIIASIAAVGGVVAICLLVLSFSRNDDKSLVSTPINFENKT